MLKFYFLKYLDNFMATITVSVTEADYITKNLISFNTYNLLRIFLREFFQDGIDIEKIDKEVAKLKAVRTKNFNLLFENSYNYNLRSIYKDKIALASFKIMYLEIQKRFYLLSPEEQEDYYRKKRFELELIQYLVAGDFRENSKYFFLEG